MSSVPSVIISLFALAVSATTAWLTLFRRGLIKMTTPTGIYFGADGGRAGEPKIYLRTLLYCTAKRGRIVESMFARVRRGESIQNFNIWVYGEDSLARGSGVFVGEEGVVGDHHFLLPKDGSNFEFKAGDYTLEIFASYVHTQNADLLFRTQLTVTPEFADKLTHTENGLYFDWGSDTRTYHPHIRPRPGHPLPTWATEAK